MSADELPRTVSTARDLARVLQTLPPDSPVYISYAGGKPFAPELTWSVGVFQKPSSECFYGFVLEYNGPLRSRGHL